MELNKYQELAQRTSHSYRENLTEALLFAAINIPGEAGEIANYVKKVVWHRHPFDPIKMVDELGDLLWYIQKAASDLGFTLEDIATYNIEKLKKRYPDGFSSERSINREEQNV